MTDKPTAMWLGRYPMTDPAHAGDLEQRASIHEFSSKLPRHQAEERAHEDYKRDQLVEAAAHHYSGMRAAHAAEAPEEAQKHGAMYILALRAMGQTNSIYPPDEVTAKAKHLPNSVYSFKAHPGDGLAIRTHKGEDKPLKKAEALQKDLAEKRVSLEPDSGAGGVESRRYGAGGRITMGPHAGKKNPYFNYDDYVPADLKSDTSRSHGITIHQRGKNVIASLSGGQGEIHAFRHGDGGYVLVHDSVKKAHPIVQKYRPHVIRALHDHLKAAHGARYFIAN